MAIIVHTKFTLFNITIEEIERHIAFRDYLREHPEVCRQYGEIKSQLDK
ncbi:GrpB family protein [Lysinibacillus sp. NPDC094177]